MMKLDTHIHDMNGSTAGNVLKFRGQRSKSCRPNAVMAEAWISAVWCHDSLVIIYGIIRIVCT